MKTNTTARTVGLVAANELHLFQKEQLVTSFMRLCAFVIMCFPVSNVLETSTLIRETGVYYIHTRAMIEFGCV